MRAALLALLVAAEVAAAPRVLNRLGPYPRLDRRDRLAAIAAPDISLFRLLSPTSSVPGGECSGDTIVGTRGESVTFSRGSDANCQKADGTWVNVTSNKPRASNLMGQAGVLIEQASTNLVLYSRDLSNAVWTRTNATCTVNAVGIGGASSTASTCVADAGNATVTQSLTSSGARVTSFFIKRGTGTGTVELTRNNGSTWTALTSANCVNATTYAAQNISSSSWSRCYVASNVTNPIIGLRVVTSGDSIIVDGSQDESLTFFDGPSSPIFTTNTSVARSSDSLSISNPTGLTNSSGCWASLVFKTSPVYGGANPRILDTSASYWSLITSGNSSVFSDFTNTVTLTVSPNVGVLLNLIGSWSTAANQLALRLGAGSPSTVAYDNTILGSAIYFGTTTAGAQSINGWMGNIRIGAATGDCAQ